MDLIVRLALPDSTLTIGGLDLQLEPLSWLGILYLALLSTVVGYFFYVVGVSKIGAGRAAIFGNLVPVFGVITSVLLLKENLSPWHGVSFLLILTGVILVNRQQKKHELGKR